MKQGALVAVQARDGGPFPIVQDATGVDQDVTVVADDCLLDNILHLHIIAALVVVPVRTNDLVLGFDVMFEAVLVGESVKVFEDFLCWRIDGRPVKLGLKAPCIIMRRNITGTSRACQTRCLGGTARRTYPG